MENLTALNRTIPVLEKTDNPTQAFFMENEKSKYVMQVCRELIGLIDCSWEDFPENGMDLFKQFLIEQEEDIEKINFEYDLIWRAWKNEFIVWVGKKCLGE